MKIALVHDWLFHMRGGEKVLESFAELYPEATIYTLFYDKTNISPSLQKMSIKATFLQHLPKIKLYYRWFLPIMPFIVSTLNLEKVDLVLSSSHCVAKGVRIPKGAKHICYCHTPMRYAWGFEEAYFNNFPRFLAPLFHFILNYLRKWDKKKNKFVDLFIANSKNVQQRIKKFYGREAEVIYPPADIATFRPVTNPTRDYYLVVSAFVPYKRVDLVIESFNQIPNRKLIIVGNGPMDTKYRNAAKSHNIQFLGSVSGDQLKTLYANASAVIFPTDEDFGIVPVEAQACGTPVIAYGKGGALESVDSGLFFPSQTAESLLAAIEEFECKTFDYKKISQSASRFDKIHFKQSIQELINRNSQ